MHVLVAVNESETSQYALSWTLEHLIPKQGSSFKLTLLTVVEPPGQAAYYYAASGPIYSSSFLEELNAKADEAARELLKKFKAQVHGHDPSLPVELIIGKGEVRDELVDYADSAAVDLLVVGSRGLGALKRTFVGSSSDYAVHHCHCPVLVVKRPSHQ